MLPNDGPFAPSHKETWTCIGQHRVFAGIRKMSDKANYLPRVALSLERAELKLCEDLSADGCSTEPLSVGGPSSLVSDRAESEQ